MTENWFVVYDTGFLPDTVIRLGQLVTDPRKPAETLQQTPVEIDPGEMTVEAQTERNVVFQKHSESGFALGLSAAVLSILPCGIGGNAQKGTIHRYEINKVERRMFRPSRKYVQASVQQPDVLKYLARHRYRKSLFMIVGIKVGFNGQVVHQRKYSRGGHLSGSIPGAVTGVPVDLGASVRHDTIDHSYERKAIPASFVFAYRLREIRYFKKDNSTTDTDFTKGAELHCLDESSDAVIQPARKEPTYLGTVDEIDIDGIVGEDFEEDD